MNSFYSEDELKELGLKRFGANVFISKKCSIYGAGGISIGNNARVDDFCILSGEIEIGSYVHIAAYCGLFASDAGIVFKDFSTCSSRCSIYAITDDFLGQGMTNPTVPDEYRKVYKKKVVVERHAILGAGCVVLPGVSIGEGTAVGAMSFVNKSTEPWMLYVGTPARPRSERSKNLLTLEEKMMGGLSAQICVER